MLGFYQWLKNASLCNSTNLVFSQFRDTTADQI